MQLASARNLDTNEDEYLAIIRAKTAALFSAAAEVGPIIAGAAKSTISAFRSYGMNLGLAFQLIDDALDYGGSSAALGKNVGDDFREGKVTLPVVLSYRRGTNGEREFWRKALVDRDNHDENLAKGLKLIQKYDAISHTVARARHYAEMARDGLAPLTPGAHKDALIEVLDFCVHRAN